jgi:hypothetical protein
MAIWHADDLSFFERMKKFRNRDIAQDKHKGLSWAKRRGLSEEKR